MLIALCTDTAMLYFKHLIELRMLNSCCFYTFCVVSYSDYFSSLNGR